MNREAEHDNDGHMARTLLPGLVHALHRDPAPIGAGASAIFEKTEKGMILNHFLRNIGACILFHF